jgi:hypothetical protein
MVKKKELVSVTIDVPDENWDELVRSTGESDPSKVVEAVMRSYLEIRRAEKSESPDA